MRYKRMGVSDISQCIFGPIPLNNHQNCVFTYLGYYLHGAQIRLVNWAMVNLIQMNHCQNSQKN